MSTNRLLLTASHIEISFGAQTLFTAEKLEILDGDRIGLTGINGSGKTTLLRILAGELEPEKGHIERRCATAMIHQPKTGGEEPISPESFAAGSLTTRYDKSGGERMRRAIGAAFGKNAPLLFADEPTTNLDLAGLTLLEKQLKDYRGAVVLVSHDRELLDGVCTSIWAIEDGEIRIFPGNYSAWTTQRERERVFAQFEYEQYRKEKQRLEAAISDIREEARSFRKPPKRMGSSEWLLYKNVAATQQRHVESRFRSMEKRVSHMEEKKEPSRLPAVHMACEAAKPIVSKIAARVEGLTVRYGSRTILENASFTLPTGSRTVMLGDNGSGKTTLCNALAAGDACVTLAGGIKLGYFSQNHELLRPDRTVLENVREGSPLGEAEARSILANLLLPADAVTKPVGILSGGERAKTAFARLLASDCNLLLLDEPTNHIDFYAAEALEGLLCQWSGTLLVVTHDRRLAENIAQRLLFVEQGSVKAFEEGWDAWKASLEKPQKRQEDLSQLIEQMRRAADAANG